MPGGTIMRLRHATKCHRMKIFIKRIISRAQKVKMEFTPLTEIGFTRLPGFALSKPLT